MAQRYIPRNPNVNDINLIDITVDTAKVLASNAAQVPMMSARILNRGWDFLDSIDHMAADGLARVNAYLAEGRKDRGISEEIDPLDVQALTDAYVKAAEEKKANHEKRDAFYEMTNSSKEKEEELKLLNAAWNGLTEEQKKDPAFIAAYEEAKKEILASK